MLKPHKRRKHISPEDQAELQRNDRIVTEYGQLKKDFPRPGKEYKDAIFYRDEYKCAICGQPGTSIHHIIPYLYMLVTGRGLMVNHPHNLVVLCDCCHNKIHNRPSLDHHEDIVYMIDAARRGEDLRNTTWDERMKIIAINNHYRIADFIDSTPMYDD